jgi:Holliday junction resolvasome RuvABC ATP-dependent DNA helicase subunit
MAFFETEKVNNVESTHSLWVEKYRPKVLNEYIGNDLLKEKVEGYL